MTDLEKRLLRALNHVLTSGHAIRPDCWACMEAAGFATIPGYRGDEDFGVTPHFDGISRRQAQHRPSRYIPS